VKEPMGIRAYQHITIRIKGHLPDRYFESFEGMQVTNLADGETLISGDAVDQAQLFGVINRIRDLGIPLLAINCFTSILTTEETDNEI
jgi:hypothetical protein